LGNPTSNLVPIKPVSPINTGYALSVPRKKQFFSQSSAVESSFVRVTGGFHHEKVDIRHIIRTWTELPVFRLSALFPPRAPFCPGAGPDIPSTGIEK